MSDRQPGHLTTPMVHACYREPAAIRSRPRMVRSIVHASRQAAQDRRGAGRLRPGRRGRAGRRAVDDDDRHGGRGGDGPAVHRAGRGGVGDGPRDRQPARGRSSRAGDQAADARRRRHGTADRRLPLQRPPAADALPALRGGTRQVPDQSRQRRHRAPPRRAVLDHLQGRARQRASRSASASTAARSTRSWSWRRCRRTPTATSG